jgi:hypothetical protein
MHTYSSVQHTSIHNHYDSIHDVFSYMLTKGQKKDDVFFVYRSKESFYDVVFVDVNQECMYMIKFSFMRIMMVYIYIYPLLRDSKYVFFASMILMMLMLPIEWP